MISIIGYGNLSKSLITGLRNGNYSGDITVYDPYVTKKLHKKISLKRKLDADILKSKLIFLGVKPDKFKDIAKSLQNIPKNTILVSLMAGISIKKLRDLTHISRIARVMTNINCAHGKAQSFVFFNSNCEPKDKKQLINIFDGVGKTYVVSPEKKIDIVTGLTGSGPAYVLYILEIICSIFEKQGFNKKMSRDLSIELFDGTINTCKNDDRSLEVIKKSIVSKKGTTESALKSMNKDGLQKILNKAVGSAIRKASKIGS